MSDLTPEAAPPADAAGTSDVISEITPPEWLGNDAAKFWDAEKKAVDPQKVHTSYRELQKLIGAKVPDLGIESRRKLAEHLPEALRDTWAEEYRAKLAADPEFLTPLQEQWKAANTPQVPEAYAPPADIELNAEHPMLAQAAELAKEYGLPQAAYDKLVKLGVDLVAPYEQRFDPAAMKAALGPDTEARANIIANRIKTLAGEDADALIGVVENPAVFRALEAVLKAGSSKPLALDPSPATAPAPLSKQELDSMVADPRYHPGRHHDPIFRAKADQGFRKLYGETL